MKALKASLLALFLMYLSLQWVTQAQAQRHPAKADLTPIMAQATADGVDLKKVPQSEADAVWQKYQMWKVYPINHHTNALTPRANVDQYIPYAPVFMDPSVPTDRSWTDWNRLDYGIAFIPDSTSGVRSFIDVHSVVQRTEHWVYQAASVDATKDANNKATSTSVAYYDLTLPPVYTVFNRAMNEQYFGAVHHKSIFADVFDPGRFYFTLGISPDGFKLGSTTSAAMDADKATYLIGGAYAFNPYIYLNYGFTTNDGKRFTAGFGISMDIGIISKIFK